MKTFTFETKRVYGNFLMYPACPISILFANLLKIRTFQLWQLKIIKSLGYGIYEVVNGNPVLFKMS